MATLSFPSTFKVGDVVEWHIRRGALRTVVHRLPVFQAVQVVVKSVDGEYARIEVIDEMTPERMRYTVLSDQLKKLGTKNLGQTTATFTARTEVNS